MRGAALALLGIFAVAASCTTYGSDAPVDPKPVGDAGASGSAADGATTHDGSTTGGNEGGPDGPKDASDEQLTPVGAPVLVQSQSASLMTGATSLDVVLAREPVKGNTLLVVASGFGSTAASVKTGSGQSLARLEEANAHFELSLWTAVVTSSSSKISVSFNSSVAGPVLLAMEWANLGKSVQAITSNGGIDSVATASIASPSPHSLVLGMAVAQTAFGAPQGATVVPNADGTPLLAVAYVIADPDQMVKITWTGQPPGAWDAIVASWAAP